LIGKGETIVKIKKNIALWILIGTVFVSMGCEKHPAVYKLKYMRSRILKKPERAIHFAKSTADFWKKTYDHENGGFFTVIALNGDVKGKFYKLTLSQSRVMYAFSRAYMLTGRKEYLAYAGYAWDFLRHKCYDTRHGGFHTAVDYSGKRLDLEYDKLMEQNNRQKEKWSFMQHYALLGPSAMVDATRDPELTNCLIKARALLDKKLYDTRKGYEGYYESADYDWRNPRGKGFTPTLDCITTHGLSMFLLTNNRQYKKRLVSLADAIVERMFPTSKEREIGFEEYYDSDWNPRGEEYIFVGHMLKAAWCLQRVNLISPREEYSDIAEKIMHNINQEAWDNTYGGPYYYANGELGDITDDNKNYWTLEQGITSGLLNYYLTDNALYLKMADESAAFFEAHIMDREYGDVFDTVKHNGERINFDKDELKGSYWKSAYHSLETMYYMYLYANLFFHKKPVRLYYYITKSSKQRVLPMNPIAEVKNLVIVKVEHNGSLYKVFDAQKRLLTVPAGVGGEFIVTYAIKKFPEKR
jgi:mannose/cellobiose epimerase-like protein (N-acyl-D-glucosamine 2-epimerase family)